MKLNFEKGRTKHKTFIGGLLSIAVNICLFTMIISKTHTMVTKNNNQISSYTTAFDVDKHGAVMYNETKMVMYWVLRK